jgi:TonB-linked SusC/RagA family outer membrane protein
MRKIYRLLALFVFLFTSLLRILAQDLTVTGTVYDNEGETLPGVSVVAKGTTHGTVTDIDGNFNISVKQGTTLVFSYIGFETKETIVTNQERLHIVLDFSSIELEEIVAIGYGSQSRTTLTTSVSKVSSEEFRNVPSANPLNQLQGKVAGLSIQISDGQPGASPQLFIRGGASTSPEGDTPLIIVDGIVGGVNHIGQLNPNDIESMQVLKDASSTAIYGARAAYGIIIVTTKGGQFNSKARVNVKYNLGREVLGKKYNFTTAREYIEVSRKNTMLFNTGNPNNFLQGGTYGMSTGNSRNSRNTLEFLDTYIQNYGQEYVRNLIDNEGWETMIDPVTGKRLIFKETNYQDVTFQSAVKHDLDVDISGGTDRMTYYAGIGYLDQEGLVLGTYTRNLSFLLNTTYKISDQFVVDASANYQDRDYNSVGNYQNVLSRSVTMPFTYRLTYEDGLPAPGEGVNSFRNRNHEWYYRDQYKQAKRYNSTYKGGFTWYIMPELSLKPTIYHFIRETRDNSFEAYNEVQKNRNASASTSRSTETQFDAVMNYKKNFLNHHNVNAIVGTSYIYEDYFSLSGSGYGAPTDNIKTLAGTIPETQRTDNSRTEDAMLSFFGRLTYDYQAKYLFSASLRRDGSSRYAKDNRWGLFPGLSAGWNVHKEPFWEPLKKQVSTFKLRSSWGQAGNNELTITDTQGAYSIGFPYAGEVGVLNTTLANRTLKWETTTSFDIGADLGFFNDRLNLVTDVYQKVVSDRLFDQSLDGSTGFSSIKSNYGSIKTRGIDIELTSNPVHRKDFTWDLSFTFSFFRSIADNLPENGQDKNRIGGGIIWDKDAQAYVMVGGTAEGERFGGRWAYNMIGVYATDEDAKDAPFDVAANGRIKEGGDAIWEDTDENGIIDTRDLVFMGYIRPDRLGGMVNSFRYKRFGVRFVMDYALGHVIDNSFRGRSIASARNNNMTLKDVIGNDIWKQQGDIASIPKYSVRSDSDYGIRNHLRPSSDLSGGGSGYKTNNSLYYKKGDFLAFRELSFSYQVPKKFTERLFLSDLELYGGIYNIGYITAYDGLMPEVYTGNDQGSYARPRQYNLGIQLTF